MGDERGARSITEIADRIYMRWGASARPAITSEGDIKSLLAISFGLGAIFSKDADAEKTWLHTPNRLLRATPYRFVLQGRYDEVLEAVNRELNR